MKKFMIVSLCAFALSATAFAQQSTQPTSYASFSKSAEYGKSPGAHFGFGVQTPDINGEFSFGLDRSASSSSAKGVGVVRMTCSPFVSEKRIAPLFGVSINYSPITSQVYIPVGISLMDKDSGPNSMSSTQLYFMPGFIGDRSNNLTGSQIGLGVTRTQDLSKAVDLYGSIEYSLMRGMGPTNRHYKGNNGVMANIKVGTRVKLGKLGQKSGYHWYAKGEVIAQEMSYKSGTPGAHKDNRSSLFSGNVGVVIAR